MTNLSHTSYKALDTTNYYAKIIAFNTTAAENATRFGLKAGLTKYVVV